jgi:hypothetical protein
MVARSGTELYWGALCSRLCTTVSSQFLPGVEDVADSRRLCLWQVHRRPVRREHQRNLSGCINGCGLSSSSTVCPRSRWLGLQAAACFMSEADFAKPAVCSDLAACVSQRAAMVFASGRTIPGGRRLRLQGACLLEVWKRCTASLTSQQAHQWLRHDVTAQPLGSFDRALAYQFRAPSRRVASQSC